MSHPPGVKLDTGKLRYDLVDGPAFAWLAAILTYGAVKYTPEGWRKVDNAQQRYYAALMRHLESWRNGDAIDEDSGIPNLACVMFAAMCLCALECPRDMAEIRRITKEAIARLSR